MNLKNSFYKVNVTAFNKEIEVPSSKSYANRALIWGAMRGNQFKVLNLSPSTDVENLLLALKEIGISFIRNKNEVVFHNKFPDCECSSDEKIISIKTGDGGTTNRFLMALLALGAKTYKLTPSEKMLERPLKDLIDPLKRLQVKVDLDQSSISITGPAVFQNIPKIEINCEKSTQFATAMILAFSHTGLKFDLLNIKSSRDYIKMTEWVLSETKIKNEFIVPVDFSSMSYPIALALICGKVLIKNCKKEDLLQADSRLIKIAKDCGADLAFTEAGLLVTNKNKLSPFDQDASECPDLIMTLCYLASVIDGESTITNLHVLKCKESDRLNGILELLKIFKVNYSYDQLQDVLKIKGNSQNQIGPISVLPERDHRMVMMAYLFLRTYSGGELSNTDCVQKSFPGFFEVME